MFTVDKLQVTEKYSDIPNGCIRFLLTSLLTALSISFQERLRIQSLEEARVKAEAEMSSAHEKLKSLEEERKLAEEKVRSVRHRVCSVRVPFDKLNSALVSIEMIRYLIAEKFAG